MEELPAIIYLSVSYEEKDEAKKLGAWWDSSRKSWYIPTYCKFREELLEKFGPNTSPVILHGEDRAYGGDLLFVDCIPSSCWFTNVRSCIHPRDWDRVRKHVYERANYICECCGIDTQNGITEIEAHERWDYDHTTYTQKLMRLIALCHECHQSTHMGLAGIQGFRKQAEFHLSTVRGFTDEECKMHISDAMALWRSRSRHDWSLDLSLLESNGITLTNKPNKDDRSSIAETHLQ